LPELTVIYWRDIPAQVTATDGSGAVRVALPDRFQEAIDEAAMRLGATGSDAYLDGWTRGDWTSAEGNGPDVCDRVVAELEQQWPAETLTAYLDALGPAGSTE
jgi:hypothetical protein